MRLAALPAAGPHPAIGGSSPLGRRAPGWEGCTMPDHHMSYVECDIPAGLTVAEWRRVRSAGQPARTRRAPRFWQLARA